jgi:hypothetical protein
MMPPPPPPGVAAAGGFMAAPPPVPATSAPPPPSHVDKPIDLFKAIFSDDDDDDDEEEDEEDDEEEEVRAVQAPRWKSMGDAGGAIGRPAGTVDGGGVAAAASVFGASVGLGDFRKAPARRRRGR